MLAGLGLLPTALSHGIGSETQRPLATAVIGGLLTAEPAVLLILPVSMVLLMKARARKAARKSSTQPA
jgi:cobalt-zinc-cadmium resistance protein CzcA